MFTFGKLTLLPYMVLLIAVMSSSTLGSGMALILALISAILIYRTSNLYKQVKDGLDQSLLVKANAQVLEMVQGMCNATATTYTDQVQRQWYRSLLPVFGVVVLTRILSYQFPEYSTLYFWLLTFPTTVYVLYSTLLMFAITNVQIFESEMLKFINDVLYSETEGK